MLIESFLICALTMVSPFYDCDQKWDIEIYDDYDLGKIKVCPNGIGGTTIACAVYMDDPIWDIISNPKIKLGSSNYIDEWGMNSLQHEIKHIQCRCSWHD